MMNNSGAKLKLTGFDLPLITVMEIDSLNVRKYGVDFNAIGLKAQRAGFCCAKTAEDTMWSQWVALPY
ncbi:MAG: hypothetical protein HRU04_10485 [Oceanospirillaceae bacterium]|nr:hypothetical protein [Oceanospirillaceae bacterium]